MKKFKVKTKFVFLGHFEIVAETKQQAREMVEKHCGLVIGGNIHTSLPDEVCPNWDFDVHPEKTVSTPTKAN
jgi:hypothetical protein